MPRESFTAMTAAPRATLQPVVGLGQSVEGHEQTITCHAGEPLHHAIGQASVLRAQRRDDERAHRTERSREESQEVERADVGGVHILEDPHRRRTRRDAGEGRYDLLPELEDVALVVGVQGALSRVDAQRAEARPQGKVWRRVCELPRVSPGDDRTARLGVAGDGDCALSDASLAGDERELPASACPSAARSAAMGSSRPCRPCRPREPGNGRSKTFLSHDGREVQKAPVSEKASLRRGHALSRWHRLHGRERGALAYRPRAIVKGSGGSDG
jgi:hypothetical protein